MCIFASWWYVVIEADHPNMLCSGLFHKFFFRDDIHHFGHWHLEISHISIHPSNVESFVNRPWFLTKFINFKRPLFWNKDGTYSCWNHSSLSFLYAIRRYNKPQNERIIPFSTLFNFESSFWCNLFVLFLVKARAWKNLRRRLITYCFQ